jgi:hypothetical protein
LGDEEAFLVDEEDEEGEEGEEGDEAIIRFFVKVLKGIL